MAEAASPIAQSPINQEMNFETFKRPAEPIKEEVLATEVSRTSKRSRP